MPADSSSAANYSTLSLLVSKTEPASANAGEPVGQMKAVAVDDGKKIVDTGASRF
jgi:hypothetical protein